MTWPVHVRSAWSHISLLFSNLATAAKAVNCLTHNCTHTYMCMYACHCLYVHVWILDIRLNTVQHIIYYVVIQAYLQQCMPLNSSANQNTLKTNHIIYWYIQYKCRDWVKLYNESYVCMYALQIGPSYLANMSRKPISSLQA